RPVDDERVELALLAGNVYSGLLHLRDELGVEDAPEDVRADLLLDGDDDGAESEPDEPVDDGAPPALPEREKRRDALHAADPLDPRAVLVEVDVAEHAGGDAAPHRLGEQLAEGGFIALPG